MPRPARRLIPWVGLVAVVALAGAAAAIGSESSQPAKRQSTSSSTTSTTVLAATMQTPPPLCQNGNEIPKGALSCLPVGIYPDAQASQLWGWTFEVTNDYAGVYKGQYVQVFAGAVMAPPYNTVDTTHGIPDGGGVRVSTDHAATYQQFLAPDTSGPLSIKAVSGTFVTLQREDGTTITFDLATDTYS